MVIKDFEQWLREEGKARQTIASYVTDVKEFQCFLETKSKDVNTLSRFSFVRYKEHLLKENYAVSTINKKINSLKVYNDFLIKIGVLNDAYIQLKRDQVKIASGSEAIVNVLSDEEIDTLLFYVENKNNVSQRNQLIIYLLLYTGVRVSELIGIKLTDIDTLTNTLKVIGKGGKHREIGLREDVCQLIRHYRAGERARSRFCDSPYLLVSQRSEKMHRDAVRDWLSNVSSTLGFKLYPHLFRHTFCTRLIKRGVDLTTVSKLAGHSTVTMIAKYYIQTTREEKQAAVDRL